MQGESKAKKRVAQVYSASELQSEKRKPSFLEPRHLSWLVSGACLDPHSRLSGFTLGHVRFWRTEWSNESNLAFLLEAQRVVSLEVSVLQAMEVDGCPAPGHSPVSVEEEGALNPQHWRVCSGYYKECSGWSCPQCHPVSLVIHNMRPRKAPALISGAGKGTGLILL